MKSLTFKNKKIKYFLDFISRLAITSIFMSAIPGKLKDFDKTVQYISAKGFHPSISSILLVGAIICLTFRFRLFCFW